MYRLLAVLALSLALISPALAQEQTGGITVTLPADLDPSVRTAVMQELAAAGAEVDDATVSDAGAGWQQAYSEALDDVLAADHAVPELLALYWDRLGGIAGLVGVVFALALGVLAWLGVARLTARPATAGAATLPPFRTRLRFAGGNFGRDLLGIIAFLAVSFVAGYLILPDEPPAARLTLSGVAGELMTVFIFVAIARLISNPIHADARLAPLTNDEARLVWRTVVLIILVPIPFVIYRRLVVELAGDPAVSATTVIATEVLITALRVYVFWRLRRPMAALIEHSFGRGRGVDQSALLGFVARYWFIAYAAFALLRLLSVVSSQLSGTGLGEAADFSFTLVVLLPFIVGGIGAWFDDRSGRSEDDAAATTFGDTAKALLQGVATVVGIVFVLRAWGVDPMASGPSAGPEDRLASALLQAAGAIVVGWAIWRGVKSLLDRYTPDGDEADMEEDGFGKTGSRIDTLIPVFRSAALVVIVVVSTLTALTAIGINIAPLLAGAGVIGLAVGFGAQTLVKDVITGVFYLMEDAFRVGEYLVTDEGKGVVEKISLRSVRLRHHRGPVYTIPFGSMGTVQNHSRDWVKVKLLIRVPFETDIEKVRRLIKKVGISMMDEPELADNIIAPVKSQGVLEVDDSAMIIGVKFICKPGEQFVVRREAYARIQKAFADNGIEFAPKRVIVESDGEAMQQARAGAAAQAAASGGIGGMDPPS